MFALLRAWLCPLPAAGKPPVEPVSFRSDFVAAPGPVSAHDALCLRLIEAFEKDEVEVSASSSFSAVVCLGEVEIDISVLSKKRNCWGASVVRTRTERIEIRSNELDEAVDAWVDRRNAKIQQENRKKAETDAQAILDAISKK